MTWDLNAASKVAQDIVDIDHARYMANEMIQNWVGPGKKAVEFIEALERYTYNLNNAMEDLGLQIMLTREYMEVRAGLSYSGSEEDKARPSGPSQSATSSDLGTPREEDQEHLDVQDDQEDHLEPEKRQEETLQDLNPGADSSVRGLKEPQDQAKKSQGDKASDPESIRQPGASKDPEWIGLNNPDLDRIPMTTAYGGPTLIADQVKPLMLMDPGNLVDVALVVVDTTAKLKERDVDYMSLLKK
jgi:hypothetical protein